MAQVLGWVFVLLALGFMIWFAAYSSGMCSRSEQRANKLLRAVLTPEQSLQLTLRGYLEVPSPSEPQRVYRIPRARGLVQVREHGEVVMRLCLQPIESLPSADIVMLHKLMIEGDEKTYIATANKL